MQLSENQILFLNNSLKESGVTVEEVRSELLDHLCCETEQYMNEGLAFSKASEKAITHFQAGELEKLNAQFSSSTEKSKRSKTALIGLLALIFFMSGLLYIQSNIPEGSPVDPQYHIATGFGEMMHPVLKSLKMHNGIDYKVPMGTPVKATADGTISFSGNKSSYGNTIIIDHTTEYKTLYAHLSTCAVKEGTEIKKGDIIGYSGNSGASTLPHLHYEIIKGNQPINPIGYMP